MRIFISGGCKNGKSTIAEKLAIHLWNQQHPCYYVATMRPVDDEDKKRIVVHQNSRKGLGFTTVEIPTNIENLLSLEADATYLLDSTTALLSNEMFCGEEINQTVADSICLSLEAVLQKRNNIVIVSDYIYGDGKNYDELTEQYRRGLAQIDRTCAKCCDTVIEVCFTNMIVHKGRIPEGFCETIT